MVSRQLTGGFPTYKIQDTRYKWQYLFDLKCRSYANNYTNNLYRYINQYINTIFNKQYCVLSQSQMVTILQNVVNTFIIIVPDDFSNFIFDDSKFDEYNFILCILILCVYLIFQCIGDGCSGCYSHFQRR